MFWAAASLTAAVTIQAQTPPSSFAPPTGVGASPALTGSPKPDQGKIDAEKEKLIRSVLARTKEVEMAQERMLQALAGMKQLMTRVPEKYWEKYRNFISPEDLQNRLVQVYDKHYTKEELKELLRFYDSPLGKKISDEAVPILRDSMQIAQEMSRRAATALSEEMRTERLLRNPRGAGSFDGTLLAPGTSPAAESSTPTPSPTLTPP